MRCYVCEETNWVELPEVNPKKLMLVCKECGNACFKSEPEEDVKIKEYYKKEYRPAPNFVNLVTTTNKQNYISIFLKDFLKDKKDLIVGDVGCATGYLLNWFRSQGHKATGCEMTLTFRRFAEHFYGIPVTEELETKHKYDLITLYHVFEHLISPDVKLEHYLSLLKDGGHFLIATPKWFENFEIESGEELHQITQYFHENHINMFSRISIKNVFRKSGLEIVKEDYEQYGQTYLLQKTGKKTPIVKENYREILDMIDKMHKAFEQYKKKNYSEAINIYPNFPEAHIKLIFEANGKDATKQEDLIEKSWPIMQKNVRFQIALASWLYQHEKIKDAMELFNIVLNNKPNPDVFMWLGWCYFDLGMYKDALKCFYNCGIIAPMKWQEAMNWACKCASMLPTWDEVATEELKQKFFEQNKDKVKIEPKDLVMTQVENQVLGHKEQEKTPQKST